MLHLIKKELTANIRYMLMGFAFFVVYAFIFTANGKGLFMLCYLFCFYSISNTNLIMDERYKIDLFTSSLPIRRRDIVISKFLLIVVVFALCYVFYTLMFAASRYLSVNMLSALDFESAMLGLLAVSLFNGITLPLSYKFGANSMRYVGLLLFFAMFLISPLLKAVDFGSMLKALGLGKYGSGLLLLAGALIINLAAFPITYFIYAKKDFK